MANLLHIENKPCFYLNCNFVLLIQIICFSFQSFQSCNTCKTSNIHWLSFLYCTAYPPRAVLFPSKLVSRHLAGNSSSLQCIPWKTIPEIQYCAIFRDIHFTTSNLRHRTILLNIENSIIFGYFYFFLRNPPKIKLLRLVLSDSVWFY